MSKFNTVYVSRYDGGFEFGLDALTPVTWYFTNRKLAPKHAYRGFTLGDRADQAKIAALPKPFIGTMRELQALIRK